MEKVLLKAAMATPPSQHSVKLQYLREQMIPIKKIACLFALAALTIASGQADDLCYEKADSALFRMKIWSDLRTWHDKYLICDVGYVGEGITEFVTATLATHWDRLNDLQTEIEASMKFKAFVLGHIDASADGNNLKIIIRNTEKKCSSGLRVLCNEIHNRAQLALKEMIEN